MYCPECRQETELLKDSCKHCSFDLAHIKSLMEGDDDFDNDREDEFRTAKQCAQRCVVLYGVITVGHGQDRNLVLEWFEKEGLSDQVSENEMAFLQSENPGREDLMNATWRMEGLALLLWALGKINSLSNLSCLCDVDAIKEIFSFYLEDTSDFIETAELRPEVQISRQNDDIYGAHWAVRDARLKEQEIPDELYPGVIYERHYAIHWLMGYCGQEWDDVTTDT